MISFPCIMTWQLILASLYKSSGEDGLERLITGSDNIMYKSFFGLTENPFHLTPDPKYLFFSPYHKEALDHLLYGITEKKGFIVITGGIGTGKTTLCRVLLEHLESNTKTALIFHSFISDMELLESIIQEFGIRMASPAETKKDYMNTSH